MREHQFISYIAGLLLVCSSLHNLDAQGRRNDGLHLYADVVVQFPVGSNAISRSFYMGRGAGLSLVRNGNNWLMGLDMGMGDLLHRSTSYFGPLDNGETRYIAGMIGYQIYGRNYLSVHGALSFGRIRNGVYGNIRGWSQGPRLIAHSRLFGALMVKAMAAWQLNHYPMVEAPIDIKALYTRSSSFFFSFGVGVDLLYD